MARIRIPSMGERQIDGHDRIETMGARRRLHTRRKSGSTAGNAQPRSGQYSQHREKAGARDLRDSTSRTRIRLGLSNCGSAPSGHCISASTTCATPNPLRPGRDTPVSSRRMPGGRAADPGSIPGRPRTPCSARRRIRPARLRSLRSNSVRAQCGSAPDNSPPHFRAEGDPCPLQTAMPNWPME